METRGDKSEVTEEFVVVISDDEVADESENQNYAEQHESEHHHSHHHSHHHHSHHHHHHHRSKKEKLKKFWKKHSKVLKICSLSVACVLLVVLVLVANYSINNISNGKQSNEKTGAVSTVRIYNDYVYVGMPVVEDDFQIISEAAQAYLDSNISVPAKDTLKSYRKLGAKLDLGQVVSLAFDVKNIPSSDDIKSAKVEIADNDNYNNSIFLNLDKNYSVDVYNLKANTKYYYRVHIALADENTLTYGGTFKTAEGPRLLNIDGIRNVRDIGGWNTIDGKTVKQGLLYRGTELDGAVESDYKLTEKGVDEMNDVLNIAFDMDLRFASDGIGKSALGNDTKHQYYGIGMYEMVFEDEWKPSIRNVFSDLARSENYPIYMHCTHGCDRTGTVCYILEAVLGLSEDDLIREYELSCLSHSHITRDEILKVYNCLQKFEGETIQDKAESYLLSIGVTEQEIASIRSILLSE